jgi:thiamine-phosphate pyrophosphorylase
VNISPAATLYGILDLGYVIPAAAPATARRMIEGGVDLLQLRAKNLPEPEIEALAREIHTISSNAGVPLIINDHPRIAAAIGAEGVHVGQDDLSVAEARSQSENRCGIGKSTHSLQQAIQAEAEGADYIGFGPLFATPTKPDYTPIGLDAVQRVHENVRIPIFCIGGIKLENLHSVLAAGASRVVVVSGILQAADVPAYCRALKSNTLIPCP